MAKRRQDILGDSRLVEQAEQAITLERVTDTSVASVTFGDGTVTPSKIRPLRLPIGCVTGYGVYRSVRPVEGTHIHRYKYVPTEGYEHIAQTKLWWVHETYLETIKNITELWTENGYELHIGEDTTEDAYPQVITKEWQERKRGGRFAEGRHDREALVTSHLVWLTIEDAVRALNLIKTNSNIPVAVAQDAFNDDSIYKEAFALSNDRFQYYFEHGTPYDERSETRRKKEAE